MQSTIIESSTPKKKSLIILGGSSFMGLTLLQALAQLSENFSKIYVINRGRTYWDNLSS